MKQNWLALPYLSCLCLACLTIPLLSPLAAQEPKLRRTLEGHDDGVWCVAFSPDGKTLASASRDKTVKLWDVDSGKNTATLKGHTAKVFCVVFSPDGKTLASGSYEVIDNPGEVILWDVASRKEIRTLRGIAENANVLAFSPDSKTLAVPHTDWRVRGFNLWDVASGEEKVKERARLKENDDVVQCLVFTPDGKTLAAATASGLMLWNLASGERTKLTPERGRQIGQGTLTFSPDGKKLLSPFFAQSERSDQGAFSMWDMTTGKVIATVDSGHEGTVNVMAFRPDGKLFASGGDDNTIKLWDTARLKEIGILKGHTRGVYSLAFSPDGKTLASGSPLGDKAIRLWDIPSGQPR